MDKRGVYPQDCPARSKSVTPSEIRAIFDISLYNQSLPLYNHINEYSYLYQEYPLCESS